MLENLKQQPTLMHEQYEQIIIQCLYAAPCKEVCHMTFVHEIQLQIKQFIKTILIYFPLISLLPGIAIYASELLTKIGWLIGGSGRALISEAIPKTRLGVFSFAHL